MVVFLLPGVNPRNHNMDSPLHLRRALAQRSMRSDPHEVYLWNSHVMSRMS